MTIKLNDKMHFPMTQEEIFEIPPPDRIFIFWHTPNTIPKPEISIGFGYIHLCIETFHKTNPNKHLFFLNHYNIGKLLDFHMDWARFRRIPLSMQCDMLQMAFLLKYGGIFLDADTVFTGNIDWLTSYGDTVVTMGSYEAICEEGMRPFVNFGFFATPKPSNCLLGYGLTMQKITLANVPKTGKVDLPWNAFGDLVFWKLVDIFRDPKDIVLIERTEFFPDVVLYYEKTGKASGPSPNIYVPFYFSNEHDISADDIISKAPYNMILLYNGWTPEPIKKMTRDEFLAQDFPLTKVFKRILEIG